LRILFIGDPHLKINRFDLAKQFLTWLNQLIEEQKPDLVVNLGDTFDTHAVLRSEITSEFMVGHVYKTLDLGIKYFYLLGNHDMYKPNDAKYHAMLTYKDKIPNLTVIDKTIELHGMTFVPYQPNAISFPKKTLPICVAHQTFIGADYGPIRAEDGVDASSIEGCEIIISGHIHKKHTLGQQVLYVGSPFSQNASDVDQIKGITIFDTATYETKFFETPLPKWRSFKVEVTQEYNVEELNSELTSCIKGSKDHWVVELTGPKAEIVGYLGSEEYKIAKDGVDVKVKTNFTDKEKKKISIEAKSMDFIISEFVVKVYNGSLDKTELIEAAKIILNESRLSK
jgi:DNA repair exonuclease SbcCD nuclease subunit